MKNLANSFHISGAKIKAISINGLDDTGKTEQIKLLSGEKVINCAGGLGAYSNHWPKLNPIDFFNWWFQNVPCFELFSIIIESIKRRQLAHEPNKLNIDDRGTKMFRAVCAATLSIREKASAERAIETVNAIFDKELGEELFGEEEVLLKPSSAYQSKIKPILQVIGVKSDEYLPWQRELYIEYQTQLSCFMNHYFRDIRSDNVVLVDDCILSIQNKLRRIINRMYGVSLPIICETLEKLVAFGGMSESGKSSFAERLSTHHHYCRLKIKYFEGVVRNRDRQSRPDTLGREILDFLCSHRHITHASIESLHGADLPAYLKLLLGSIMTTVFLDTQEAVRVKRTAQVLGISEEQAKADTRTKDALKLSRGADRVRDIADIVFDNSRDDFEEVFKTFIKRL